MPNLVGIGLSQVPTNGMLGGMAYQDPEYASIKDLDLKNLSQINSEIADTAVDVLVYDTRKDSDGGAWRKRTQNTSWYNETLGTSDRGNRKEFPAVAVIVATASDVIIYDGDDPDLPMWMIFESSDTGTPYDTHYLGRGSGFSGFHPDITGVAMLNATLVVVKKGDSTNYTEVYTEINFISDRAFHRDETSACDMNNTISSRNGSAGGRSTYTGYGFMVDHEVRDVAMTLLPNAPINPATGLPFPTIACGTDNGLCVIYDYNTVKDYTSFAPVQKVKIDKKYVHAATRSGGNDYLFKTLVHEADIAYNSDIKQGSGTWYANTVNDGGVPRLKNYQQTDVAINPKDHTTIRSSGFGLEIFNGLVNTVSGTTAILPYAYVTSSYNTGYMIGNNKGAYLADTDTTDKTNGQTEPDRTLNGYNLTVTGTITKSACAPGAELVAYSGFSGSNKIEGTTSAIDFGSVPNICYMCWMKQASTGAYNYMISNRGSNNSGGAGIAVHTSTGNFYIYDSVTAIQSSYHVVDNSWHFCVGIISKGHVIGYVDGKEVINQPAATPNMSDTTTIAVGHFNSSGSHYYPHTGSLALARISASIPSPEQVKQMYKDELPLFQENAKCTLYGSSDAVTALAFDDTTNLLHAGTSAGRSEFQGLSRINNTTTAVTTAISASNGLVAEQ